MHSDSFSETQHSPRTRDILHTGHPAHTANKRTNGGPSWYSRRHIPYATPCAFHECNVGMDFHGRSCCCVPGAGTHMRASTYCCQCRHTHACQPVSGCGMVRENGSSAVRSAHGAHWTDHGEPQTEDSLLSLGARTAPASCSSTAPRTGDMGQWTCPTSLLEGILHNRTPPLDGQYLLLLKRACLFRQDLPHDLPTQLCGLRTIDHLLPVPAIGLGPLLAIVELGLDGLEHSLLLSSFWRDPPCEGASGATACSRPNILTTRRRGRGALRRA